jgi:YD repeat-containing protein
MTAIANNSFISVYDAATGKQLWRKVSAERVPHEGHHTSHSYAAGSPTTDGTHLFVSFGSFGNYCYDLNGNLRTRATGGLTTTYAYDELDQLTSKSYSDATPAATYTYFKGWRTSAWASSSRMRSWRSLSTTKWWSNSSE